MLAVALPLACSSSAGVPAEDPSSARVSAPPTEPAYGGHHPAEPAYATAPLSLESLPRSGLDAPEVREDSEPEKPSLCRGSLSRASVEVLTEQARQTKPCYDRLLRGDAGARGRMFADATYELSGEIRSFALNGPITDAELHACVAAAFKEGLLSAPPTISCVTVRVPLMFVPREKNEGEGAPVAAEE